MLLPSLCVGSDGAVESVQLSRSCRCRPSASIAVTGSSASSVVLVRVLFPHAEIRPEGEDADARLLIGDAGAALGLRRPDAAPRPGRALARAHGPADGVRGLGRARDGDARRARPARPRAAGAVAEAPEHADVVARAAASRYGFPAGYLARYFEKLRYGFGERERAGLARFYELAAGAGAIDERARAALRRRPLA